MSSYPRSSLLHRGQEKAIPNDPCTKVKEPNGASRCLWTKFSYTKYCFPTSLSKDVYDTGLYTYHGKIGRVVRYRSISFSCPTDALPSDRERTNNTLGRVSYAVRSNSFILLYKASNYKGAAVAQLFGNLVPRCRRKACANSICLSKGSAHSLSLFSVSLGINSMFRGPHSRFFGISAADRLTFNPRGRNVTRSLIHSHMGHMTTRLGLRPLLSEDVFSLSNNRGRGVTYKSTTTVSPSVCILSRPSSGLSTCTVTSFQRLLFALGSRKGAVVVSRRQLCCLSSLFSHILCLGSKRVRNSCATRRFYNLSTGRHSSVKLQPLSLTKLSRIRNPPREVGRTI